MGCSYLKVKSSLTLVQARDYLNPNDVVSIEVLKDASSICYIWGARGD